jgi:predicted nuclease of predicted toxin-antitoxin system
MKLLLDQGIPRPTADLLRAAGHDAVHTAEIGMATSKDDEIIDRARAEDRHIVTFDADFHSLLALKDASNPSVIRIRIERLKAQECAKIIERVAHACTSDLQAGAAISVEVHRTRVRRLPLSS